MGHPSRDQQFPVYWAKRTGLFHNEFLIASDLSAKEHRSDASRTADRIRSVAVERSRCSPQPPLRAPVIGGIEMKGAVRPYQTNGGAQGYDIFTLQEKTAIEVPQTYLFRCAGHHAGPSRLTLDNMMLIAYPQLHVQYPEGRYCFARPCGGDWNRTPGSIENKGMATVQGDGPAPGLERGRSVVAHASSHTAGCQCRSR
jgi:hypothetical protein